MIAFVGGMIFAGNPAEASQGGVGALIDELWLAIDALDGRISTLENIPFDPTGLQTQIDSNDADISQLQTDVTDVDGRVTSLEQNIGGDVVSDSFQFTNPVEREILYSPDNARDLNSQIKRGAGHTIPDNALITGIECPIFDDDSTGKAFCRLAKVDSQGNFLQIIAIGTDNAFDGGDTIVSQNVNEMVQRENYDYLVEYHHSSCGDCVVKSIKLTYTVDEAD